MDRLLGEEGVRAAAWLEPGGVSGPLTGVTLSASAEITFIALGGGKHETSTTTTDQGSKRNAHGLPRLE